MINITNIPDFFPDEALGKIIISNKSAYVKRVVEDNSEQLQERFSEYLFKKKTLESINPSVFSLEVSSVFVSCYQSMPVSLKRDLDFLRKTVLFGINLCPYCLISEPDTNDHYLPKEEFPEFSFYLYNLVPCCSNCNRRKGSSWIEAGKRVYVNPYFDDVEYGVMGVEISLEDLTVNFYCKEDASELGASHVKKMDLVRRYNDQGVSIISRILVAVEENPELENLDLFKEEMEKEYKKVSRVYGENYYESVIYKELSL